MKNCRSRLEKSGMIEANNYVNLVKAQRKTKRLVKRRIVKII